MSCSSDCGSCSSNPGTCGEGGNVDPKSFLEAPNEMSKIRKVIGVVSGKGGVGKSMVTSMLAVLMRRKEFEVAILDADITGPSIPKEFGLKEKASATEVGMMPVRTKTGISVMSVNLLLENDTDPVVWRGPILAGTVTQFWKNVIWDNVDYMFVDMPPGTGDVPLTVFQSLPVDGLIVVTSPQDLVSMIVAKAVNMAKMMKIPVLGLVENMSYFQCPNCQEKHAIFGESHLEAVAAEHGITNIARIPLDRELSLGCDKGLVELFNGDWLNDMADMLEDSLGEETAEAANAEAQREEAANACGANAASGACASAATQKGGDKVVIAVPFENGEVFQHFGHSERFKVYTLENGEIVESRIRKTGASGHSALGGMLAELGVNVLICGGIGGGAKAMMAENSIAVFAGVTGDADEAVASYMAGKLAYDPEAICQHHEHGEEHSCGEHSCGEHSCH